MDLVPCVIRDLYISAQNPLLLLIEKSTIVLKNKKTEYNLLENNMSNEVMCCNVSPIMWLNTLLCQYLWRFLWRTLFGILVLEFNRGYNWNPETCRKIMKNKYAKILLSIAAQSSFMTRQTWVSVQLLGWKVGLGGEI